MWVHTQCANVDVRLFRRRSASCARVGTALDATNSYHTPMSKRNPILCVRRDFVERMVHGREGFIQASAASFFMDELLSIENAHFIPRHLVEEDETYLQIIPYSYFRDAETGDLLYYVRAAGGEARLLGKTSIGFGGHVELTELAPYADIAATVRAAGRRELEEELNGAVAGEDMEVVGLILASDSPVDRVHMGVVYRLPLETIPEEHSDEIVSIHRGSASEIAVRQDLETWSRLVLEHHLASMVNG